MRFYICYFSVEVRGSACKLSPSLWKCMQARSSLIEARGSVVGLMEASGITGFGHGNAWIS